MTLIGILAGAFGGITLAEPLALRLKEIPTISPYSEFISFGVIVLGIAYLTLILGELVPKRLALSNPEKIASAMASYLGFLTRISSPFVFVLGASTDLAIWIMGIRPSTEPPLDEEEIKILIDQGTDAGVIEEAEQDIMERVFRLGDRRAGTLMTPRSEIVWLDIDDTPVVIQEKIAGQRYSLFPVCKDDIDNILGVVQAKDLLSCNLIDKQVSLKEALLPPLVVPDSMKALKVLERFKETGIHLALVLDEYGSVQGLITLADLLEALVGDIPHIDELKEPDAVKREDGSWLINGMLPIDDFKAIFEIDKLPKEDNGLYQTVGGFVMISCLWYLSIEIMRNQSSKPKYYPLLTSIA
jgi:putative hemolysin